MEDRQSKDPASGAALAKAEEAAGAWDPCACEGEGAGEGGDAAPRDATVPGARAQLDVGGRAARGAL
jgi:hypothetical protein